MNKFAAIVVPVVLLVATTIAQAQSISAWESYRAQQKEQAAPATPAQAPDPDVAASSSAQHAQQTAPAYPPADRSYVAPAPRKQAPRGGFFVGAQGGTGWVYEDVDQRAVLANAGYRWQAGPYSQVGIELGAGRLNDTTWQGYVIPEVKFSNVGANARFNFGDSRWFATTRLGYWRARTEDSWGDKVTADGAYAGLGLGVDVNRHFNLQLMYTAYAYSMDYYYDDEYDISRADTVTVGAEVRF